MNTILIIDDEAPYLSAMTDMLTSEGYQIIQETGSNNILEWLNKKEIKCIIIDAVLSGESGFDVSRKLKDNPDYADIPLILTIPKNGEYNLNDAITSKGNDCIQKPINKTELLNKVAEQLRLAEEKFKNKNIKEKYFQLLECTGRSLVIINKKFTILGNNSEFLNFIGVQSGVVGSSIKDIFPKGARLIDELMQQGSGNAEIDKIKLNLAPLGDDYIVFIENDNEKKEIIENVLLEYYSWTKIYSSSDLAGLVENFINIIRKHLAVSSVYMITFHEDRVIYSTLEEPDSALVEFDCEKSVAYKVLEKGKNFSGNFQSGVFEDMNYLVEQGYKSGLFHLINLTGTKKVLCFVHDYYNAYAAPLKDINVIIQEFFVLYNYMVQKNELEICRDAGKSYPVKALDFIPQPVIYCKNGVFLYANRPMQKVFGSENFEANLLALSSRSHEGENVLAFMKHSVEEVDLEFATSNGTLYKIHIFPESEGSTINVFEDITHRDKMKSILDFHHSLARIMRSYENIDDIFKEFRGAIKKFFPANDAAFILLDNESGIPVVKSVEGKYSVLRNSMPLNLPGSVFEKILITKDIIINNDLNTIKICSHEDEYKAQGVLSYLSCPVVLKGEIYGSVEILSQQMNVFTEKHKQLAETLAEYVMRSIVDCVINTRLLEKEKLYHAFLELSGEALISVHESGKILDANDALLSLLGYTSQEARNMHIKDICAANTRWELLLSHHGKYDFKNKPGGIKSLRVSSSRIAAENYLVILHQPRTD